MGNIEPTEIASGYRFDVYCMSIAEWDDDMTYLYVDYPLYKKYIWQASIISVSIAL
jgi:hypothetical protein